MKLTDIKRIFIVLLAFVLIAHVGLLNVSAVGKVNNQADVSSAIHYEDSRKNVSGTQAVNMMEINVSDPNTSIQAGIPSKLNQLHTVRNMALKHHTRDKWVAGAINASFFNLNTRKTMNLISKNNKLVQSGRVYPGNTNTYVNQPIAFGMNSQGKGQIDRYNLNMSFAHDGQTYSIDRTNDERKKNKTILYTTAHTSKYTETNEWGTEVVVKGSSAPSMEFGSTTRGTVTHIRKKREKGKTKIPENGFVISGNGKGSKKLQNISVGDSITLSIDIDDQWKQSEFMLASGPMLVKDGQVHLTMNPNSPAASQRAPRTAVAIDSTGEKVFFVTVDGRQSGYSKGVNLSEFAQILVEAGADRALNLDGGGSTTMLTRMPGNSLIELTNRPSDGFQRSVSTALMALSTEHMQLFRDVENDHWGQKNIEALYKKGTIEGYPRGEFRPSNSITRAETAVMLSRDFGLSTNKVTNPQYKDISNTHKYYKEIAAVSNAGFFEGRGQNKFADEENLKRGEMAVLLKRALNLSDTNKVHFNDVKTDHFAYDAAQALGESGISTGYPDGTFKVDKRVTRAELSQFLVRAKPDVAFLNVKDIRPDELNVRKKPTTNSGIAGQLSSFDHVAVRVDKNDNFIKSGQWYKITFRGKERWVHEDYVE